jgi:dephospho-CoA kinase
MARLNYFIEGLSGTGKTTVCEELKKRGFNAVEADAVYAFFGDPKTGEPTDEKHQFNWMWDLRKVNKDLNDKSREELFVCGGAMNQLEVEGKFDKVFTLFLNDKTLEHRLMTRTNNSFGKKPEDLARQLKWNTGTKEYAEQRGTTLVDASQPLANVVDSILNETSNTE